MFLELLKTYISSSHVIFYSNKQCYFDHVSQTCLSQNSNDENLSFSYRTISIALLSRYNSLSKESPILPFYEVMYLTWCAKSFFRNIFKKIFKYALHSIRFTLKQRHCMKSVQIQSFFYSVSLRIQSECGKIRTRKNSVFGHMHCVFFKEISN